ncbi:MAG TPA: thioredoxin domain-containing protein [Haliangium sp.]|nr:thioredoxin domain-containing protein [Haliangium sp.]
MRGCIAIATALLCLSWAAAARAQPTPQPSSGAADHVAAADSDAPDEPDAGAGPGAPAATPRAQIAIVRHRPTGPHPALGPALAPVTIDFFAKPDDRTTATLHRQLVTLQQRHPRRVRIVYRIVGPGRGHDLAVATLEAFAQGRFQPFFDAAMTRPDHLPLTRESIAALCREVGVDVAKVEAAWARGRHDDALYANEGVLRRRTDTAPGLLFNGRDLGRASSMNLDTLEAHYRNAHEQARLALGRGVPLVHLYEVLAREHAAEQVARVPREFLGAVDDLSPAALRDLDTKPRLVPHGSEVPGHELGNPDAPVTVHVYCRFLSTNCAMLRNSLATLREEFPGEVRVVFHHLLPEAPGDQDASGEPDTDTGVEATMTPAQRDLLTMHVAALCADEQGAFWDFYRLAFQPQMLQHRVLDTPTQSRRGDPTAQRAQAQRTQLARLAQITALLPVLPVDIERFQTCMLRPGGDEKVMDLVRAARKAGIVHTPTVVIGGRAYLGYKSSLDLRALVEEALLPGLLEQAFPTLDDDGARFSRDAQ